MSHRTTTRLSERNKTKEDLAKRKAEEELLFLNSKKQMLHKNQGGIEFEKKLKDNVNPFETHSRSSKQVNPFETLSRSAKPSITSTKAKEIPTKMLKIDREPIPKRKSIEENIGAMKKKKIHTFDDFDSFAKKKSSRSFQQFTEFENSFDVSSEEGFENHFAIKQKKSDKFELMSQPSNTPIYYHEAQKIIANEIPELVRSSNQTTIELLHAVQLIFHERAEDVVRVIEIHNPQSNTHANPNSMEFL
jgi:hypothetical protein